MSMRAKPIVMLAVAAVVAGALVVYLALTSKKKGLRAGFNPEFLARPDGYNGVSKAYDFKFASSPMQLAAGRMHKACKDGEVDVISAFATDGPIDAFDLLVLQDDKKAFPPYDAAPLARAAILAKHSQLNSILGRLAGKISLLEMRKMNCEVTREKDPRKPEGVARDFLVSKGLIDLQRGPGDGSAGTIIVANKNFTEQRILGAMLTDLIRFNSDLKVKRVKELASDRIIGALRNDEIDLYVEYTGTGLMNILKRPPMSGAKKVYDLVQKEFQEEYNLIWLEPLGFSNSYTLTMRREHAEKLGIRTISDLADYVRKQQQEAK